MPYTKSDYSALVVHQAIQTLWNNTARPNYLNILYNVVYRRCKNKRTVPLESVLPTKQSNELPQHENNPSPFIWPSMKRTQPVGELDCMPHRPTLDYISVNKGHAQANEGVASLPPSTRIGFSKGNTGRNGSALRSIGGGKSSLELGWTKYRI